MVREVAYKNAEKLVPHDVYFKKCDDGSGNSRILSTDINADLSPFGGLGRYEWVNEEAKRLVQDQEFSVNSHIRLLHDYAFGIGLEGIVNADLITKDVINSFINRFLAKGEKPYSGRKHIATLDMMDISTHRFSNAVLMDFDEEN